MRASRRKARAQHVDPVEGGLDGDLVLLAGKRERVLCDLDREVLGHVVIDHLAYVQRVLFLAQRPVLGVRPRRRSSAARPRWRLTATRASCPLLGQERVLAGDEALFGVVRVGDLEQVLFIEQAELDGALFDQGLDLESTQCGDEVESAGLMLSLRRALVSIPRSPTNRPARWRNRSLSFCTWQATVLGSPVLPLNTSTVT